MLYFQCYWKSLALALRVGSVTDSRQSFPPLMQHGHCSLAESVTEPTRDAPSSDSNAI